ncbi:pyridoxal-phosphate dependent enzyme [Agarilytica rhodophyticola]|uniref:pyridoxal-phosphate dependent enzyme n=1 Tax=Agarilytica rhodophyticola TaxID=1737490 RepID=UPI0013150EF4|nr:pyridoxal-phosphate dependent enzyme [Agarilytica rhodophyticola]
MISFKPNPQKPLSFFQQLTDYQITPTIKIEISSDIELIVKNEGERLGLGSFKGLGGMYAVAHLISDQWEKIYGKPLETSEIFTKTIRDMASSLCFVCASAGNHGIAVATGARLLGARSRVYLSESVPASFEKDLLKLEAQVIKKGSTYEASMEAAIADAKHTQAILLADSSWPGYHYPPSLIMEGYTVIADELRREFEQTDHWPSHVYLQAGVGGFAGAMTYMIRHSWQTQPSIYIVEPEYAPCLKASHEAGKPTSVKGSISSMGRLDCKNPSIIAFNILQHSNVHYLTVSEKEAEAATHQLQQHGLITTPSGAAGYAAFIKNKFSHASQAEKEFKPIIFITENNHIK